MDNAQEAWRWQSAAVEPTTGPRVCRVLPRRDGAGVEVVWHEWRQACPAENMAVGRDHRGTHTSPRVTWPAGLAPVSGPAESPERHPGERWVQEWREPGSPQGPDHIEALEASLTQALRPYGQPPSSLVQLTAYPW